MLLGGDHVALKLERKKAETIAGGPVVGRCDLLGLLGVLLVSIFQEARAGAGEGEETKCDRRDQGRRCVNGPLGCCEWRSFPFSG